MKESYRGYKPGDRLRMVYCADPYNPVPSGTEGTVDLIDDMGTLHVSWEDGRRLGVCLEVDEVERV